jgi:hypothetical protein
MSEVVATGVLVVLNVAPAIEDDVVDWLLGREGDQGFTRTAVHGHGARSDGLTIAEQVTGRRDRVQFEVCIPAEQAEGFLRQAAEVFGNADVHYQLLPLLGFGRLQDV